VWGAGSGPQAFGSKVKQTEEEEDLQSPLLCLPGEGTHNLLESQFWTCLGEPVLTWTQQAPHSLV